jgi:hypothetical protein
MLRVSFWATTFACVAGVSLAAPSVEQPVRAPQPEQPTLSQDWSLEGFAVPPEEVVNPEGYQIAKKGRGGGGKRGGAKRKNRGGFKNGNKRNGKRHVGEPGRLGRPGEPGRLGRIGDPGGIRGGEVGRRGRVGDRDVNIDRDVDIDRDIDVDYDDDWDDDDDDFSEAVVGGIIGAGIGSILTNSQY